MDIFQYFKELFKQSLMERFNSIKNYLIFGGGDFLWDKYIQ